MADENSPAPSSPEPSPDELRARARLERFGDIVVKVDAVLGRTAMPIEQFLKLGRGAILELDQTKEDDVDLCVNGTVIAKGEICVLEDAIGITVKTIAHKNNMYEFDAGE